MPHGTVALADDPDHQCRHEIGWDPPSGHVLLCGGRASGTTTALAALALDVARRWSPDEVHLLVADLGGGTLAPLAGLPHTGAVVTAGDRERIERFVRVLRKELDRRRDSGSSCPRPPRLLVLIDGLPALRAELEEARRYDLLDELDRVLAEGPEVGVAAAIAVDRLAGIPAALAATVAQKWLFRPADPVRARDVRPAPLRCAQLVPGAGPPRRPGTRGASRRPWPSRGGRSAAVNQVAAATSGRTRRRVAARPRRDG